MQSVIYGLRQRLSRLSQASLRIAVALPFLLLCAAWAILVGTLWSWTRKAVEPWQLVTLGGNLGAPLCAFLIANDKLPIDEMTGLLFVAAAVRLIGAAYLLNKGHEAAVGTREQRAVGIFRPLRRPCREVMVELLPDLGATHVWDTDATVAPSELEQAGNEFTVRAYSPLFMDIGPLDLLLRLWGYDHAGNPTLLSAQTVDAVRR